MKENIAIERVTLIDDDLSKSLSELLVGVVESGASIGFLPPLRDSEAIGYWQNIIEQDVILLVAKIDNQLAGTIQIHLCSKQNGKHRAEIAKLMTHPDYQRRGIGRMLMFEAEKVAKQNDRSLIVLDTREGDVSNTLYKSMGYVECGRIPHYALSASGYLDATIYYYKSI